MTDEELDWAKGNEALRRYDDLALSARHPIDLIRITLALERSGWTPPPPAPAPEVLAAREYLKGEGFHVKTVNEGLWDGGETARTFLAGVAWARKEGGE